ncbi:MAG: hypothetical protein AAGE05_14355 [Pseudomonadota bacterium]
MADALVTRSSGAIAREYPRGTRIADNQVIRLRTGDSVTVLTRSGTRQYNRPGRYRIGAPLRTASSGVTTMGQNGVARTGVSRGIPAPAPISAANRTVWQLDIEQPGAFCTLESEPVSLWRANASQAVALVITRTADGESMTVNLPVGQFSHSWPENFAPSGGGYTIAATGDDTPAEVSFVPIDADPNDPLALGSALLSNQCEVQLEAYTANYQTVDPDEEEAGG